MRGFIQWYYYYYLHGSFIIHTYRSLCYYEVQSGGAHSTVAGGMTTVGVAVVWASRATGCDENAFYGTQTSHYAKLRTGIFICFFFLDERTFMKFSDIRQTVTATIGKRPVSH